MKKIIIVFSIFFLDRASKIYLLNLQESGTDIDFYIYPLLNFYLVWNTGIGFGLVAMESNIYYHVLTSIILIVNIGLVFFLVKSKGIYSYLLAMIIGGSLGNLFDRIIGTAQCVRKAIFIRFAKMLGNYHFLVNSNEQE